MSELDKFFKDKLNDRTFEFKDAYWEAAEQLIEKDNNKKRKRGGFWRWTSLGLLLLLVVTGYFVFGGSRNNQDIKQSQKISEDGKIRVTSIEEKRTSNTLIDEEVSTKNNIDTRTEIKERTSLENNIGSEPSAKEALPSEYRSATGKGIKQERKEINPLNTDKTPEIPSSTKSSELLKADSVNLRTDTSSTRLPDMAVIDKKENQEVEQAIETRTSLTPLNTINTVATALDLPEVDCEDCFDFGKVRKRALNFSLLGEGIVYPFEKDANWWTGGALGLGIEYAFNRNFSLRSGAQYAMIRALENSFVDSYRERASNGSFDETIFTNIENQYAFGLREVEQYQLPKTIHYFEIPLMAQLRHKRHKVEAGVHMNFLIGARGRSLTNTSLFPWEQDELTAESDVKTEESDVWLPKDDFRKILTNASIGYRYRMTSQLSLGLNAYYRLGKSTLNEEQLDTGPVTVASEALGVEQISPRRLHFRMGLQWHF